MKKMKLMVGRLLSTLLVVAMSLSLLPLNILAVKVDDTYVSGKYTGEATGYNDGKVTVYVTLDNQSGAMEIAEISAEQEGQTPLYWDNAISVLDKIKTNNGTDGVDTVSSATQSSRAIIIATDAALLKAKGENVFDGGSGTKNNPYLISSQNTLSAFSAKVAEGTNYAGKYISLNANLDLADVSWTPIGNATNSFAGIFDGNGYTISNMNIGSVEYPSDIQYAGLFGYVLNTAEFHNTTLTNVQIYTEPTAMAYAGALVSYAKVGGTSGTVFQNCHADGKISVDTKGFAIAMVGGLIGFTNQYTTVASCSADVEVSLTVGAKTANAGGLIGFASVKGLIMNSYATGDVYVDSTGTVNNAGGFIGGASAMIYSCYTSGNVTAKQTQTTVGGFAGNSASATLISECYYNSDKVVAGIGKKSGIGDAIGKNTAEIASEDFISLLSNNLSILKQAEFADLVKSNSTTLIGCDYETRAEAVDNKFYDWKLSDGKPIHSNEVWANSVIDTTFFESGTGTEIDPYIIKTEAQLRNLATSLTARLDYSGVYIELGNDIDLVGGDWTPIGEGEYPFNGFFDGKGHTISGLSVGTESEPYEASETVFVGLFGVLGSSAEIRNLNLNVALYATGTRSIYVGGLSGYVTQSLIDNVNVSGKIKGSTTHSAENIFIGGIGGSVSKQKIINSSTSADVRAESIGGIAEAGGICGLQNRGLIANCYTTGNITGTSNRAAEGAPSLGGIAGVHAGTIANCYSVASIVADCYTGYVGALAGWATGIADTFQSYYGTSATLVTDNLTENRTVIIPAVSIGWSVGPGINDEGEAYTGSVSLNVEGLSNDELTSQALADKLNNNFNHLNVNLAIGGRQSGHWSGSDALAGAIKKWTLDENRAVLSNETATVIYDTTTTDAINKLLPEIVHTYHKGTFYGRDKEKTFTLKVTIGDNNNITGIVVMSGLVDSAIISEIVNGVKNVNDLEDSAFKSALEVALKKAEVPDYSTYGLATNDLFAKGSGTQTDPWIIKTEDQLTNFASFVNEDENYQGKYIELGADITLTKDWTPAGSGKPWSFAGHLDGKGYTIHGMKIGSTDSPYSGRYAGLFAYIKGGTVNDLNLAGMNINIRNNGSSRIYVGGIAAAMEQTNASGYIDDVHVDGNISAHSNSGATYAGGLLGQSIRGTITNSSAEVAINAVSDAAWVYAGGLIATPARCGIFNNYAIGSINASGPVNKVAIGGLVGFQSGAVYNCYAEVDLISNSSTGDIGGLAGRLTGIGLMKDSFFGAKMTQQSGSTIISEKKAVGTIVSGSSDGCGVAEGLIARDDLSSQEFAELLNSNCNNTEALNRVYSLLSDNWSTPINENIKLLTWATVPESNVSFGATSPINYTLTFDTSEGTAIESVTATSGTIINLSEYTPSKEGYTFDGWYLKDGNEVKSVTLTEDITVYAKWVEEIFFEPFINGYDNGTFKPENGITRAETAKLLYNISGKSGSEENSSFSDVQQGSWYYDAVTSLTASGIIEGYEDQTFRPENSITRAEFTALVFRYSALSEGGTLNYSDVKSDHWAAKYIAAATQAGYIEGYPEGTFKPEDSITRAEAVKILNRVMKRPVDAQVLKDFAIPFSDVPNNYWAYYEILEAAVKHIAQ